ncbi:hypothetical protein AWRIB129_834 [Oenococcus oeni DSM 20252 = AWRIB129]|nr:hypothetical protein [Oenococcus oeni]EKP89137.1 hypothetical protein AWRIB129_834 [Oenococcus oeni DSM 20252 = AWRIB129]
MINFFQQTIEYFLIMLGIAILIPAFFAWLISYLINRAGSEIISRFGTGFYLFISSIGVIVHELSHLLLALFFGHHIENFHLLQVPKNGQVGFVTHSSNPKNLWQAFGNLLIGFAPMIGNSLAIYYLTLWLQPEIFSFRVTFNWSLLVWFLISFSLALGIGLSHEDFQNSLQGLWPALLILLILAFLFEIINKISINQLLSFSEKETTLFGLALIIALIELIIAKIISAI